jgi:hypothetical protein
VYSIVDLDKEMLVARYVGAAEVVAVNLSILQASLASLEPSALLVGNAPWRRPTSRWTPIALGTTRTSLVVPAGWIVESGGPSRCGGGEPAWSLAASPVGDFTVQLRAAWRPGPTTNLAQAARGCAPRAGTSGETSYVSSAEWWGTTYQVDGVFAAAPAGVWHLEVVAPAVRSTEARALLGAWVTAIVGTR